MLLRHDHLRRQGDLGEAAAIEWLTRTGANVWKRSSSADRSTPRSKSATTTPRRGPSDF
jgi:hypothetical protein